LRRAYGSIRQARFGEPRFVCNLLHLFRAPPDLERGITLRHRSVLHGLGSETFAEGQSACGGHSMPTMRTTNRFPDHTAEQKNSGRAASFAIACIFSMPITKTILHNSAA
jgi:hypothetical protein